MRGLACLVLCVLATWAWAGVESGILIQTSPLAGFQYHAGRALFPLMAVGDRLALCRESDNPHDPKAVRVEWRGAMIGYAPRVDNVDLARLMDHGVRVEGRIIQLQKARNPWQRVLFEVLVVEPGR
jgi:hypothetical protein